MHFLFILLCMKYKYLASDEYSLKPLTEGTIKYSLITDLNDPFEVSPIPDPESEQIKSELDLKRLRKMTFNEICLDLKIEELDILRQKILDSAPSKEAGEQALETPIGELLSEDGPEWQELLDKVDPSTHQDSEVSRQRKGQSKLDDRFAILCLSSDPASYLMWSHYAQKHSGFCIGFDDGDGWFNPLDNLFSLMGKPSSDKPKNSEYICNLREVKYHKRRSTFDDNVNGSNLFPYFFWKSIYWEYEAEFRMLYPLNRAQDYRYYVDFDEKNIDPSKSLFKVNSNLYIRAFDRKIIKEIIFGCKCSIETQVKIRKALKEYDVSYKFAIPSSVDYSMRIKNSQLDYPHDPLDEKLLQQEKAQSYFDKKDLL